MLEFTLRTKKQIITLFARLIKIYIFYLTRSFDHAVLRFSKMLNLYTVFHFYSKKYNSNYSECIFLYEGKDTLSSFMSNGLLYGRLCYEKSVPTSYTSTLQHL